MRGSGADTMEAAAAVEFGTSMQTQAYALRGSFMRLKIILMLLHGCGQEGAGLPCCHSSH